MDEHNMNIITTDSATVDVKVLGTPQMIKKEAQGHTEKDFSDYLEYDFCNSYPIELIYGKEEW